MNFVVSPLNMYFLYETPSSDFYHSSAYNVLLIDCLIFYKF